MHIDNELPCDSLTGRKPLQKSLSADWWRVNCLRPAWRVSRVEARCQYDRGINATLDSLQDGWFLICYDDERIKFALAGFSRQKKPALIAGFCTVIYMPIVY